MSQSPSNWDDKGFSQAWWNPPSLLVLTCSDVCLCKEIGKVLERTLSLGWCLSSWYVQLLWTNQFPYILPLRKFSHWFLQLFVTLSSDHSLIVMVKPQTTILKGEWNRCMNELRFNLTCIGTSMKKHLIPIKRGLGTRDGIWIELCSYLTNGK